MIFVLIFFGIIILIIVYIIKLMLKKNIPYAIRGALPGLFIWAFERGFFMIPSTPGPTLTYAICDFLGINSETGLLWLLSLLFFVCPGVFIGIFLDIKKKQKMRIGK